MKNAKLAKIKTSQSADIRKTLKLLVAGITRHTVVSGKRKQTSCSMCKGGGTTLHIKKTEQIS